MLEKERNTTSQSLFKSKKKKTVKKAFKITAGGAVVLHHTTSGYETQMPARQINHPPPALRKHARGLLEVQKGSRMYWTDGDGQHGCTLGRENIILD